MKYTPANRYAEPPSRSPRWEFRSDLEYRVLAPAQGTTASVRRELRSTSEVHMVQATPYWKQLKIYEAALQEHFKTGPADLIPRTRER